MTDKEYYRRRYKEEFKPAYEALMKFYPFSVEDLGGERWQNIFANYYVSNYGRIKSKQSGKVRILKPALSLHGYLYVSLSKGDKSWKPRIHKLVADAFIPKVEGKSVINHKDTHKLNNFVDNLEWATPKENNLHAVEHGLIKSGEDNCNAKLTNEQATYIRENPDNLTGRALAKKFGVGTTTISNIQCGLKYQFAGGNARTPQRPGDYNRVPDEIRNQIRAEYKVGNHTFGARALARKYGYNVATIQRIVHE